MTMTRDPEQSETQAMRELVDFAGKDVLEIGCGDGRLTWRYAEYARSVLALDPDESAVELARAQCPDSLLHSVTFQVADITAIDLPHAAFDVALLSWSLC